MVAAAVKIVMAIKRIHAANLLGAILTFFYHNITHDRDSLVVDEDALKVSSSGLSR